MTDDLVKRLRCYADIDDAVFHPWVYGEAADRIEKLETNFQLQLEWYLSNKRVLDDRIEKLEAALHRIADLTGRWEHDLISQVNEIACKALEGKDD
jgi:hypothetical protein